MDLAQVSPVFCSLVCIQFAFSLHSVCVQFVFSVLQFQYYTEHKPKNKIWGGLGTRLQLASKLRGKKVDFCTSVYHKDYAK